MNKTIDNETLLLKVESHDHRIEVLENLLNVAKEVLTLEEAALFMGISKSSLYKMTHKHELPSIVLTTSLSTLRNRSF
jgi:excisionase family DNA binding protein